MGIRLKIVCADAHHQLGPLERNHAVRREQLAIYEKTHPEDDFATALLVTNQQRNRLRNVRGFTPAQRVLGVFPRQPGDVTEGEVRLSDLMGLDDEASQFAKDVQRRTDAAKAFLHVNVSRAVRAALHARNRPLRRRYCIGEYVFYWRRDNKTDSGLQKVFWKGPALVVMLEYQDDDEKMLDSVL